MKINSKWKYALLILLCIACCHLDTTLREDQYTNFLLDDITSNSPTVSLQTLRFLEKSEQTEFICVRGIDSQPIASFNEDSANFLMNTGVSSLYCRWVFQNATTELIFGEQSTGSNINLLLGSNSQKWQKDIPEFTHLRYHNIYPGLDLLFYEDQKNPGLLKYDFIITHANQIEELVSNIKIKIELWENSRLVDENKWDLAVSDHLLKISYQNKTIFEDTGLKAWFDTQDGPIQQDIKWKTPEISSDLRIISYQMEIIRTLSQITGFTIDPILNYSTYLGNNGEDQAYDIITDTEGNHFITGCTSSSDFFTTSNAFNRTNQGAMDIFVAKQDPNGKIIFSTLIGGSDNDAPWAIAIGGFWNYIFVTGYTWSHDFPNDTEHYSYDPIYNGKRDAFVLALNASGSSIIYSTYIGGQEDDVAYSISINSGFAFITGATNSSDFPTTTGAYNRVYKGGTDAFVLKLAIFGNTLIYSTLVGGTKEDLGRSIIVLGTGEAIMAGYTFSEEYPTTTYALRSYYGGYQDIILTMFSIDGDALNYSTFFGGGSAEGAISLFQDSLGSLYVVGYSASYQFPTSYNAPYRHPVGSFDAFITKLNFPDITINYSTLIGGTDIDAATDVYVDDYGYAYIIGFTYSTDFPVRQSALKEKLGGQDGFICKLSKDGSQFYYSSFLGGQGSDSLWGITKTKSGLVSVVGYTNSSDFPITAEALNKNPPGLTDSGLTQGIYLEIDLSDCDQDGLTDIEEERAGLNPTNPDSDNDEVLDNVDPMPLNYWIPTGLIIVCLASVMGVIAIVIGVKIVKKIKRKLRKTDVPLHPPFEAYVKNKPYIFVSYAHKNAEIVYKDINILNEMGYRIWYDEGIPASANWLAEIEKKLKQATCMLLYLSPEAVDSLNVQNEITFAANCRKQIIPIFITTTILKEGWNLPLINLNQIQKNVLSQQNYIQKIVSALPLSTLNKKTDEYEEERVIKFRDLIQISHRVALDTVAKQLEMTKDELIGWLIKWQDSGFKIDGDSIQVEKIEIFTEMANRRISNSSQEDK